MSFFAELKQRKVVRIAVAYLVVAWIAIQVASIALPTVAAPIWVLRVLILLLAIGFPIALILAWAVELSPQGVKFDATGVGSKRLIGFSVALLVLAFAWYYRGQPAVRNPDAVVAAAAPERSIAVLPFVNMSGDPANEYFSDGLAETTLDMLAQVPDLKVIARTSSFAFKGKAQDMRQIGAALGAAHLLEGSVQQAGDTLRITVQLIKAADGTHLWSHHYDRPMIDLFKIQDEIASHVVQELAIALPAQQQQHLVQKRTDNVAAYQEYLKGVALLPGRKVADMRVAVEHFEKAIALDPNYARAYSAAADTYNLLGQYRSINDAEKLRAAGYVARALELAPDLGEAHISHAGWLENIEQDWAGAEREYRRGIELAPSYATGYQWYGELLGYHFGRHEEALAMKQKSAALDPLSPIVLSELISTTASVGRYQEADRLLAKLHADYPDFAQGYETEAYVAADEGDLVRALRAIREMAARDPDALGRTRAGCLFLIRFDALAEAGHCLDTAANQALAGPDLAALRVWHKVAMGDVAGAQTLIDQMPQPDSMLQTQVLMSAGRNAEALAIFRRRAPEMFALPVAKLTVSQVNDATVAGVVLLRTGAQAQARALLGQALQAWSTRPALMDFNEWNAVVIHAALGDNEQAIAALKQGIARGFFIDLVSLDIDPALADLRKDPRYQQILAPARAKAAAQVEAARKAGLLN
jgi:TolB-like protein/Flp pilus assembly protein TadD